MNKKLAYYLSLLFCLFLIVSVASAQATRTPAPARTPTPTRTPTATPTATAGRTAVPNPNPSNVTKAIAVITPVAGQSIQGTITFTKVSGGVRVVANITGLKTGNHGFHVHTFGDCSNLSGGSAGPHFNPYNGPHGNPDSRDRHIGDLGNITADSSGQGHYDRVDTLITLEGTNAIIGRALVIHQNEDDFTTQPDGNSGTPIACGVIGITR